MKKLLSTPVFILIVSLSFGQSEEPNPCGTPSFRSDWLKKYQANPAEYAFKSDDIINIPITVSRVAESDGSGRMRATSVIEAMCRLQLDFAGTDIEFYLKAPIRDINDDAFFEHGDVVSGGLKMFEYNEDGAINCYLVRDAGGNCGYNLPWAGVAVQESCARPDDHTWSHEMGHALSLPHPFLGWEGGVSHDNTVAHNFDDPAPEFVLYNYTNFKDSLILDTMIIDTAWVEKMDGSNCNEAADGFCDTKPDYLAQRWPCASDTMSFTEQTDPDGVKFKSDATLIMSYSFDNCAFRFTDEQIQAMRANALDQKAEFTSTGMVFPEVMDPQNIQLNFPIQDEVVYYKDVEFSWTEDQEDQNYLFQVGVEPTFSLILYDTITDQPFLNWHEADDSWGRLYWRVRPFTANNFCTGYSSSGQFIPSETSSVSQVEIESLSVYPNLIDDSVERIFIRSSDNYFDNAAFNCLDLNGRILSRGIVENNSLEIEVSKMDSGIYFIQIENGAEPVTFKLVRI